MMAVTRTIQFEDLTPRELAELFAEMNGDKQAQFFAAIWDIAKEWSGAGWCKQSHEIAQCADVNDGARQAITTLAAHFSEGDSNGTA